MQNVLHHVENDGYWCCFCDKFDGCVGRFSPKTICCTICQIECDFEINFLEKIKYNPERLLYFASDLLKELKLAFSHDQRKTGLWCDGHRFKSCNYQEGTEGGIDPFDSIDF